MVRKRNAKKTRDNIFKVAKTEFTKFGLAGTRMDTIAIKAKVNKNMIYYYFKSKENLFKTVLEESYLDMRSAEMNLDITNLSPEEKLITLIKFTWQYYLDNPEFIRLINSENLHGAKHIKKSRIVQQINKTHTTLTKSILTEGVKEGVFRKGLSPYQVNFNIAALGYYYLSNQHTLGIIFNIDMLKTKALKQRLNCIIDTILCYVKNPSDT